MKTLKQISKAIAVVLTAPFVLLFLLFWMNIGMPLYEKVTGKKAWNPK